MKKITVSEFVNDYVKRPIQTKEKYILENLKINDYVPFFKKTMLAEKLVETSTYKFEDYKNENGIIERKKTDMIQVNSVVQYLLFCKLVIENYTNLICETNGFYEEYDLLKSSGLLDILMVSTDEKKSLIPQSELSEFKAIIDMKKNDLFTNHCEIHNYISNIVNRFGEINALFLKPTIEKLASSIQQPNQIEEANDESMFDFTEIKK